jgi:endonuclease YncB( thermonuclease family)
MTPMVAMVCLVIGVADGDTLKGRCETAAGPQTMVLRLAEIDAPEKRQPHGVRSKQHLAALCFGKSAQVKVQAHDRYGRAVAHVVCDGVDASLEQVRVGLAWAFTRYLTDPQIAVLERQAREQRLGLWQDQDPVAPWKYRRHETAPASPF